jgi:thiamine pyrophosphate-dependent acetolactate synthase large subunit-like protein
MRARADAIKAILDRHGRGAVYVASTGYVSRAVHAVAGDGYDVFYMQGSMGLAPAIGLGIALHTSRDVVVINGDGALLMALGTTHTIRDHGPANLYHYVLDNGCHESVGGQPCAPLEQAYPGVTQIIPITRDGKPPRVGIAPQDNTSRIRAALAARAPEPQVAD